MSSTPPEKPDVTPEPAESEAPEPAEIEPPEPAGAERPEPEEHLLVDPTRVRRAPRYGAFLVIGGLVGAVVGLFFGLYLAGNVDPARGDFPLEKPGVYVTVIVASCTTVALILAGLLALLADRRSMRRR